MLLIRACLLWAVVSLHVVGGAALFRRFFPKESPWFGFVIPALALVILLNFVERLIPLASLLWLLPFTAIACLWQLLYAKTTWRVLRLPTGIFLGAFAFTFALRAVSPNILAARDGVEDLSLVSCFCVGDTVPPVLNWFPPWHLTQYYTLGPYAASVLVRLLDVDIGTGYNLTSALLSAFSCFATAAAAWRISRQSIWITIVSAVLVECAASGSTAYLWLTIKDLDPNASTIIFMDRDNPGTPNFLWQFLPAHLNSYSWRELMVPGSWSWLGSLHSTSGGQFLTLFSVWALAEVLRRKKSNWPWICLATIPALSLVTSTWAMPLQALLLLGGLFWSFYYGLCPQNHRFVLIAIGVMMVLMLPILSEFLDSPIMPQLDWTKPPDRTVIAEFLIQWWPIYIPWLLFCLMWPRLHPAIKTVHLAVPVIFLAVEYFNVGVRVDMTGKFWGFAYCAGWAAFSRPSRGCGPRFLAP